MNVQLWVATTENVPDTSFASVITGAHIYSMRSRLCHDAIARVTPYLKVGPANLLAKLLD
jgi:hypothetical protein